MAHRLCPFWVGYFLANPLRRLVHDPEKILSPFVADGMTVLDIGPAMGFFTLPLARMVGAGGEVLAVDLQEKLLEKLRKRARKAELADRITTRACGANSLDLEEFDGRVDFVLAFAVVHEVPDVGALFNEIFRLMKPGGECLFAEPAGHVSVPDFAQSLSLAEEVGFRASEGPEITWSHSALLIKDWPERPEPGED
jgi:ubiquinone/menaquinone biosynthesis C-methylase UbiE